MDTANITAGDSYLDNYKFTPDTLGEYFTTGGTYNGKSQKPTITAKGAQELYGYTKSSDTETDEAFLARIAEDVAKKYTVTWQAGRYFDKNPDDQTPASAIPADKQGDYKEIVAGSHYYRIVDTITGSVICYKHLYSIDRSPFTLAAIDPQVGFVGETPSYTIKVMGTKTDGKATDYYTYTKDFDNGLVYEKSTKMNQLQEQTGDAIKDSVTIDDTIANNNHYLPPSLTYTLKCYVLPTTYTTANTKTYFGSIVDAINDETTISGVTIYPMQHFTYDISDGQTQLKGTMTVGTGLKKSDGAIDEGNYTHIIDKPCTIKEGVVLCIPYDTLYGDYFSNVNGSTDGRNDLIVQDVDAYRNLTYLKNVVKVEAVYENGELVPTLINNGIIQIPGQISGGGNSKTFISVTAGLHSQITLGENAIISSSGTIQCRGFIDAEEYGNGSKVDMLNGEMQVVFSIAEHYGGTTITAIAGNQKLGWDKTKLVAPFNRFYVKTVTADLVAHKGALVKGFADLVVSGSTHLNANVIFIGDENDVTSDSAPFIQMMDANSKVTMSFNPDAVVQKNYLNVEGNINVNPVTVSLSGYSMTTNGVFLPLTHYWNVTFNKASGQSSATVDATDQYIKIMPGASVTIGEGVTFNASKLAIYSKDTSIPTVSGYKYATKADVGRSAVSLTDGILSVNGTLNISNNVGGHIRTSSDKGNLLISSSNYVTVYELGGTGLTYSTDPVNLNATGDIASGKDILSEPQILVVNKQYTSCLPDVDKPNDYAWAYGVDVKVQYVLNGGTMSEATERTFSTTTAGLTLGNDHLPTDVTREYYNFKGWYADSTFSTPASGYLVYNTSEPTKLYAKWEAKDYTLEFRYKNNGINSSATPPVSINLIGVADLTSIKLDSPTDTTYKFVSWYGDAACSTDKRLTSPIDGKTLLERGTIEGNKIIIYGEWATATYTVTFVDGDKHGGKLDANLRQEYSNFNNVSFPNPTGDVNYWKTTIEQEYYFEGWYDSNGTKVTSLTAEMFDANSQLTLTAKWESKPYSINLSINLKDTTVHYNITFDGTTVYIHESQLDENGMVTLSSILETYEKTARQYDKKTEEAYKFYFAGWASTDDCKPQILKVDFSATSSATIYAIWGQKNTIHITESDGTNALKNPTYTITIADDRNGTNSIEYEYTRAMSDPLYVAPGYCFKISSLTDITSTNISTTFKESEENYDYTLGSSSPKAYTGTVNRESGGGGSSGCFTSGTLITLADGTQKKIEDLLESDVLLVFDHETGKFVAAPILFIERDGWAEYNVINLKFSDGRITRLIYEHALFDVTLNKYVYITEDNCTEFIGHEFVVAEGDELTTVTLTEAFVTTEYVGCYSLVTAYHLNYFIDGMLSIPGGIDGLFNIFEYDETLKYDEEQMAKDIEKYGLYTYEDFAEYMPEEVYNMFPAQYFKVAVGKGYITLEEIVELIDRYLVGHGIVLQN